MGDRSIRKEAKKPKKSAVSAPVSNRPPVMQPELIKKEKKQK
ncbi:MAG: hypothetical protein RRY64_06570 [Oscillospiraceae bacterium]